jgi:hypothetical protein
LLQQGDYPLLDFDEANKEVLSKEWIISLFIQGAFLHVPLTEGN